MEDSASDAESGFGEDGEDPANETLRFITKFLDRVCDDARVSNAHMQQLREMTRSVVGMHVETLENVHRQSKSLPPIQKPKMLLPHFLPQEMMIMGHIRVFLFPDGRQDLPPKVLEKSQASALLPAEGTIFLTNYRLIFKGQPCDLM